MDNVSILIVDDSPQDIEIIKEKLDSVYTIYDAYSYKQMLEILEANDISLILLDMFFTSENNVIDYLGNDNGRIVHRNLEDVSQKEKNEQGYLILRSLKDNIQFKNILFC